jgi:hypothetical protein
MWFALVLRALFAIIIMIALLAMWPAFILADLVDWCRTQHAQPAIPLTPIPIIALLSTTGLRWRFTLSASVAP